MGVESKSSMQPKQFNESNQLINSTDLKQFKFRFSELNSLIRGLPFNISDDWKGAVGDHIKYFGPKKVMEWAQISKDKRMPERYFMKILSRQRQAYGSIDAKKTNLRLDRELRDRIGREA